MVKQAHKHTETHRGSSWEDVNMWKAELIHIWKQSLTSANGINFACLLISVVSSLIHRKLGLVVGASRAVVGFLLSWATSFFNFRLSDGLGSINARKGYISVMINQWRVDIFVPQCWNVEKNRTVLLQISSPGWDGGEFFIPAGCGQEMFCDSNKNASRNIREARRWRKTDVSLACAF